MKYIIFTFVISISLYSCSPSSLTKDQIRSSESTYATGDTTQVDRLINSLPKRDPGYSLEFKQKFKGEEMDNIIAAVEALGRMANCRAIEPLEQLALGCSYRIGQHNYDMYMQGDLKQVDLVAACAKSIIAIDTVRALHFLEDVLLDEQKRFTNTYDFLEFRKIIATQFFSAASRPYLSALLDYAVGYYESGKYYDSYLCQHIEKLFANQRVPIGFLSSQLSNDNPRVRELFSKALRNAAYYPESVDWLLRLLEDEHNVQFQAGMSLRDIGLPVVPHTILSLRSASTRATSKMVEVLHQMPAEAIPIIIDSLKARENIDADPLLSVLKESHDPRAKAYIEAREKPKRDRALSNVTVIYSNLSTKFKQILLRFQDSFADNAVQSILDVQREDALPLKIEFGSDGSKPYVLLNLTYRGKERMSCYDRANGLVALDVSLPVRLTQSPVWMLLKAISDDRTVSYQDKMTLSAIEPRVRFTKSNGDYFQMYIQSNGSWYQHVSVYSKSSGEQFVKHISNAELVGGYKILIFENPKDDLTGRPTGQTYVYDFFGFRQ